MASTPVAPRATSIDHELRAHFVIELVGKLDDLAAIKDGNALHRFFCVVFAPPAFFSPKTYIQAYKWSHHNFSLLISHPIVPHVYNKAQRGFTPCARA